MSALQTGHAAITTLHYQLKHYHLLNMSKDRFIYKLTVLKQAFVHVSLLFAHQTFALPYPPYRAVVEVYSEIPEATDL